MHGSYGLHCLLWDDNQHLITSNLNEFPVAVFVAYSQASVPIPTEGKPCAFAVNSMRVAGSYLE